MSWIAAAALASTLLAGDLAENLPAPPAEAATLLEFEPLNGVYSNPDPELEPVQQGPITVRLRSPENSVELFRHRLALKPEGEGVHLAHLAVEFQGEGKLEADISVGGLSTNLEDEVRLPRQQVEVLGRVRLEPVSGGFRVVAVELPETLEVTLDSRLAGALMETCRGLTRFLPLVGCGGLRGALNNATVPLPPPGTELFLSHDQLGEDGRQALARYLGLAK